MGLLSTPVKVGNKAVRGLLDMDTSSRMARANDQGYNTDVYHGSTHDLTNMDALKTNIEGDWGQGIYSSNNIDDVNNNYAGLGPDLTQRIEMEADRLEDLLVDQFESKGRVKVLESLKRSMDDLRFISYKMADLDNADAAREAAEMLAHKTIKGESNGVVYPLKLKTKDYAVIDQKNPTHIEFRDYQAEAADDLNRSDFGSDDDYEDALSELAYEMRADDYDSPLATISETLRRSGVDSDKIGEITQDFYDTDSISAWDLDSAIRSAEIYAEDDLGNMIPNGAISAQVFRDLGYKGVKDNTVNTKFPTMKGMNTDTTHYITFPQNEQTIRSVNAKFDSAKSNSTNLLASKPAATIGAGILGAIAASQSRKSYADYSPSNLARLRNDDVGGYQAAQSPQLARASGLLGQINERGVDDPLMGLISPRMPNELINKMAYNDKRGIADYLKSAAGLLGFY